MHIILYIPLALDLNISMKCSGENFTASNAMEQCFDK